MTKLVICLQAAIIVAAFVPKLFGLHAIYIYSIILLLPSFLRGFKSVICNGIISLSSISTSHKFRVQLLAMAISIAGLATFIRSCCIANSLLYIIYPVLILFY
jgi:hypothetical protein